MVQGSKVRSPATLKILPLNGTSIDDTLDAGRDADLHRIENVSPKVPPPGIAPGIVTSNRLALAPPPTRVDLNFEIVDSAIF
jgi:hypothetical protein